MSACTGSHACHRLAASPIIMRTSASFLQPAHPSEEPPRKSLESTTLRRVLGPVSVASVGVGAAIGSGIFATPGVAAQHLASPWMILAIWLLAGVITLLQSLVTAELATRFPRAGGEYQYLKEAYGEFAAFFFGWSFTIFIVGGGAGTIAALFGDFSAELLRMPQRWASPALGCAAIVAVLAVNVVGLRAGAVTQNILTFLKTAALLAIAIGAMWAARRMTPMPSTAAVPHGHEGSLEAFFLALLPVFWSYTGATDSAKMAEETRDVHKSLPRALCGSALLLTALYTFYNYALFCAASPGDMAGHRSIPSFIFARNGAGRLGDLMLAASALVCLGAVNSTILANVRVTYALARDGLAPGILARMSRRQAPIASLIVGGALACLFVLNRGFEQILRIYFMASTVLFGLTYLSLVIFRRRDRHLSRPFPTHALRLPYGSLIAIFLLGLEIALAAHIVWSDWARRSHDSLWTLAFLAATAGFYLIWKAFVARPTTMRA